MYVELHPSEINYLQDSISSDFRDGTPLLDTFRDLLYGDLLPEDIRTITVFWWEERGKWYVHSGHRRLYLFKRLQKQGVVDTLQVSELDRIPWRSVRRKNSSTNMGKSVTVRKDKSFVGNLGNIIQQWRNEDTSSSDDEYSSDNYSEYESYDDDSYTSSDDYYY
ncbi:uncharacterized protein LOC144363132 [Saccoglossus kowalevskii]